MTLTFGSGLKAIMAISLPRAHFGHRLLNGALFGIALSASMALIIKEDCSGSLVGWQRGWPQPILALNERGETVFFLLNYLTNCFYLGLVGFILPVFRLSFESVSGLELLKRLREQIEKERVTNIERFLVGFFAGNFLTAFSVCYSYNFSKIINVSSYSGWGFPFSFLIETGNGYPVFHFNNFMYSLLFWWLTSWFFPPFILRYEKNQT